MVPQCPVWSYDIEIIQDDTDRIEFVWNNQDYVVPKKYCWLDLEIGDSPEHFESVRTAYDKLDWGDRYEAIWEAKDRWLKCTCHLIGGVKENTNCYVHDEKLKLK